MQLYDVCRLEVLLNAHSCSGILTRGRRPNSTISPRLLNGYQTEGSLLRETAQCSLPSVSVCNCAGQVTELKIGHTIPTSPPVP